MTAATPTHSELIELEHAAWEALSTEGQAAPFYASMLAQDVLMLLPGGRVIDDRVDVLESMRDAAWSSYELSDERVIDLGPDSAVVAYKATAHRPDLDYTALFNSTYVRERAGWKLAVHQQTPV
jgi:hypothetical protein